MKAAEILNAWRRVAPAFGYRSTAWLKMLQLVEAGDQGQTLRQLVGDNSQQIATHWPWIRRAAKAGLVEIIPNAVPRTGGGRRAHLIKITALGKQALQVE